MRWRATNPDLTRVFAERYEQYKTQVVLPLIGAIKSCHSLIFLVDVTSILANGTAMYNDTQEILIDLLEVLDPGDSVLGRVIRGAAAVFLPHGWRPGRITKIAFVAPKVDLVFPKDRDITIDLVRRIAERPAGDRDGLSALFENCSAVVSTRAVENGEEPFLEGLVRGEQWKFRVSIPSEWPREWKPGEYVFPRVVPDVPPLRDCPPRQLNLDKLLEFAMR
jgi:predicted YcjX-like family ATPase